MEGGTGYLVAGYLLTWTVLAWYAWRVRRRYGRARRDLTEEGRESPGRSGPGEEPDGAA